MDEDILLQYFRGLSFQLNVQHIADLITNVT